MSTPETIYLIPGEYEEGLVWCDDPAPDSYSDPDDAVKYVRADHIPDAGKVITDNSKVNAGLIAENERLQARLAEKCDAPVGWIGPEKYKAACESKMKFFKTIKELREQNEKLQARVAELYDLIKYAQVDSGVCMCGDDIKDHNQASGHSPVDVWDHVVEQIDKGGTSEAFIKRKQADAVESALQSEMAEFRLYNGTKRSGCFAQDLAAYAQRLRNDAGSVRGDL